MPKFKTSIEEHYFKERKRKISIKPLSANETLEIIIRHGIQKAKVQFEDQFGYAITGSLQKINIFIFIDTTIYSNSYADISQKSETRVTYGIDETFKLDGNLPFKRWIIFVAREALNVNNSLSRNKKDISYLS
ncbi:hypothetical protein L4D09_22140 [Photobacterium makurazakiensis]|uniref:hypothetical protein n=1 Tax=Photobacterium makurazakiensis TaxID=2910234 RepID=UPI003D0D866C